MPNIAGECLLAALRFAALWTIFYLLHRPKTRLRLIFAIGIIILQYPARRVLTYISGGNFAAIVAGDTVMLLILAFICEAEPAPGISEAASPAGGGLLRPLISALYFDGMLQLINYIISCYLYAFAGALPPSFSVWSYFWKAVEWALLLIWAIFYYRLARTMTKRAPVSFSLLTILTPLAGLAIITASANLEYSLLEYGTNTFLYWGLFGTLIAAFNMCVFYLYTKLIVILILATLIRELTNGALAWEWSVAQ
jgi:hypothetical protein